MKHIAYYDYDDAPEKVITEDHAMILKLSGYMPHADRYNGTDNLYYPIPEDEKDFWDTIEEPEYAKQEKIKNRILEIKDGLKNKPVQPDDNWIEFYNILRKELKQLEETA